MGRRSIRAYTGTVDSISERGGTIKMKYFGERALGALRRYPLPFLAALGFALGLGLQFMASAPDAARIVLLATLLGVGFPVVARTAWDVLHGKFTGDVVAALAILGAAATGEYLAGCVIVLMQTGGEALEDFAVRRASTSLEELLKRAPRIAHLRHGDSFADVPVGDVAPGDRVLVRPGEVIPVDGTVIEGTSAVDESALTGEPVPVAVRPGGEVMSGSICTDGALEIRALRPSNQSQYEQIVSLVQDAQVDKAPIGRLADRYAVLFTPFTLTMCALAWALTRRPEAVVAVLVVATPCPLILATPVAIISGINRAARHGIIVKGGAAIERIGQATAVVFDKTGTLTRGTPEVERIVPLDRYDEGTILRLAAGLEQFSTHPMARALVHVASEKGEILSLPSNVLETAGQGVSGSVDGHLVDVGSAAFAATKGLATVESLRRVRAEIGADDDALAVVGIDDREAGLVIYRDKVRSGVSSMLERLEQGGVRETVMLTGDDLATAHAIASQVGITTVNAELLPSQKVAAVRDLMQRHDTVVMVGDGINDAPALATATIGVALGAHGTAISAEAADIVLLVDDVTRVADAVEIGQRTLRIAKQSIWAGLGASGAMMVAAAFGYIVPTVGALLQEALDVAVILNALRAR
jgi:heavy metal translocating P-type ATPase